MMVVGRGRPSRSRGFRGPSRPECRIRKAKPSINGALIVAPAVLVAIVLGIAQTVAEARRELRQSGAVCDKSWVASYSQVFCGTHCNFCQFPAHQKVL